MVAATTDAEMAISAYVENVQRANLSAVDEAAALARIRELDGHATAAQVAMATSQPERRVRRILRLFTAPAVVKDCVSTGLLVEVDRPHLELAADGASGPKEKKPKERRKLDLLAALEFTRLYEHHAKQKPATANDHHRDRPGTHPQLGPAQNSDLGRHPRNPSRTPTRRWPRGACPELIDRDACGDVAPTAKGTIDRRR